MNENDAKSLKIEASCGTLRVFPWEPENGVVVVIPSINLIENIKFSNGNGRDTIRATVKILAAAEVASQTNTNKSATKTLDNRQ